MNISDDLRYAARGLARRPALLTVTTATLSIGIAANAIMFGVVDQLLLRPPARVTQPDGVKRIFYRDNEGAKTNLGQVTTYPVLPALRDNTPGFSDLAAFGYPSNYSLGRGADARSASVQLVSGNFFRLLGVRPALGRAFTDEDDRVPVGQPVAIVSYGFWQELGGSRSIVGRTVLLQGKTFTIVGVAPSGFSGIDRQKIDIWLPIASFGEEALGHGWYNTTNNWWAQIIGRVAHGVAPEVAQQQATVAYRALLREWNQRWRDSTSSIVLAPIIATRGPQGLSRESMISLWLVGVSAIVLLIACANVANLLVARTLERRREIAVRLALGATRGRLGRMLLAEAALLALLGSTVALAVAAVASRFVERVLLPNVVWSESPVNGRVLAFTLAVAVLCMLLAGLAPALRGVGIRITDGLKTSSAQVAGGHGLLRFTLLLAQAALSVVLLVGAGLFVRSLRHVVERDVGIDRDRVYRVMMPLARYGFDSTEIREIYRVGAERLSAIPGVAGVAVAGLTVPMGGAHAMGFEVPGVARPKLELGGPYNAFVTSGFFATIGTPVVRGREFTPSEARTPSRVVIVNETLARAYWPDASAIGQCVLFGSDSTCSEVVGVVKTVMQFSLLHDERAIVYAPPLHPGLGGALASTMLVRVAAGSPIVPAIQRELQALSPKMPYVQVRSYAELVAPQLQSWRLGATMFTIFGVIAVMIAAIGLYSVMAYWVSQRTREIGVRMALGAQRADVVRLVAAQAARAVGGGVVVGALIAVIGSHWVAELLFETSPRDPAIYAGAALVLVVAAALASVLPARRSAAVDPAHAMRTE